MSLLAKWLQLLASKSYLFPQIDLTFTYEFKSQRVEHFVVKLKKGQLSVSQQNLLFKVIRGLEGLDEAYPSVITVKAKKHVLIVTE